MTEASYTAWDDKQYVWPPPDGWYLAADGKWWPEGYGPPVEAAEPEPLVESESDPAPAADPEPTAEAADPATGWVADDTEVPVDAEAVVDTEEAIETETAVEAEVAADPGFDPVVENTADAEVWVDADATTQFDGPADMPSELQPAFDEVGFQDAAAEFETPADTIETDVIAPAEAPAVDPMTVAGLAEAAGFDPAAVAGISGASPAGLAPDAEIGVEVGSDVTTTTELGLDAGVEVGTDVSTSIDPPANTVVAEASEALADPLAGTTADVPLDDMPDPQSAVAAQATTTVDPLDSVGADLRAAMVRHDVPVPEEPPPVEPPPVDLPAVEPSAVDPMGVVDAPPAEAHVAPAGPDQPTGLEQPVQDEYEDYGIPDRQAMLGAPPKGPSRSLWFTLFGVVVLLAIGGALFLVLSDNIGNVSEPQAVVTSGPGSLVQPHPRATRVVVFYPDGDVDQRWIVEVLEPVQDVTEQFQSGGQAPAAGDAFVATRIRVLNEAGVEGASVGDLRFNLVDQDGNVVVRTDAPCPGAPDDLNFAATVPLEGSVEGLVCWTVPQGDLARLVLGIESLRVDGRVHIQLQ